MARYRGCRIVWLAWCVAAVACAGAAPKGTAPKPAAHAEAGMQPWSGFAGFWNQHGGAQVLGAPIAPAFLEEGHVFQYFDRAVLVYAPENPEPHRVQLQRLGWLWRARVYRCDGPFRRESAAIRGGRFFEVTGQSVAPEFLPYWEKTGGLALYGMPLSRAFAERGPDGKDRLVQYFENVKLERTGSGEVRLGALGAEELGALGGAEAFQGKVAELARASLPAAPRSAYPRLGHAPDYAWVAGTLSGGCPENPAMKRPCTAPMIDIGLPTNTPVRNVERADGVQVAMPSVSAPLSSMPARSEACVESSAWRLKLVGEGGLELPLKAGQAVVAEGQLRFENGQYVYAARRLLDPTTGKPLAPGH